MGNNDDRIKRLSERLSQRPRPEDDATRQDSNLDRKIESKAEQDGDGRGNHNYRIRAAVHLRMKTEAVRRNRDLYLLVEEAFEQWLEREEGKG